MTARTGHRTAAAVAAALTAGALLGASPTASAAAAPLTAPIMTVPPTGVPGKSYSEPTGVNNSGVFVGYAYGYDQLDKPSAVRWNPDLAPVTLAPLPGEDYAQAVGVNDANLTIGVSWPASRDSSRPTAVRWAADGTPTPLPPLPGDLYSTATAISGSGIVVGTSYTVSNQPHAVAWRPNGTTVALAPLPGATTSVVTGVNSHGTVIGRAYDGISRGIIWSPDGTPARFTTVPTGGSGDWPVDINEAGTVVGVADVPTSSGAVRHGLVRSAHGAVRDLGPGTMPTAINNSGTVVGQYLPNVDSVNGHAARWSADGTFTPLARKPENGGRSIALGVNDSGTVVGYATDGIPARQYQSGRLWAPDGTLTDLDPENTANRTSLFVNNAGLVVGLFLTRSPWSLYPSHSAAAWLP
ncbi:hypothetical protein ACFCX4_32930 [Kitasatospora sp. NPDC056327]|uniref:hypothetical protein n=1 Tax=Kitasatospora sp. NPDC056327 TaxID=3345785 RepID=UPI0035DF1FB9